MTPQQLLQCLIDRERISSDKFQRKYPKYPKTGPADLGMDYLYAEAADILQATPVVVGLSIEQAVALDTVAQVSTDDDASKDGLSDVTLAVIGPALERLKLAIGCAKEPEAPEVTLGLSKDELRTLDIALAVASDNQRAYSTAMGAQRLAALRNKVANAHE